MNPRGLGVLNFTPCSFKFETFHQCGLSFLQFASRRLFIHYFEQKSQLCVLHMVHLPILPRYSRMVNYTLCTCSCILAKLTMSKQYFYKCIFGLENCKTTWYVHIGARKKNKNDVGCRWSFQKVYSTTKRFGAIWRMLWSFKVGRVSLGLEWSQLDGDFNKNCCVSCNFA